MLVQKQEDSYSNFVNSINSDQTRHIYEYTLSGFLNHCQMDFDTFLSLPQQEMSNIIVNYLVENKISRQYKVVIFSAIKHACEMNDVILNWKKLKKFVHSEKTNNSINGKDRRNKYSQDEDPDIAREQRTVGSENVRIIQFNS